MANIKQQMKRNLTNAKRNLHNSSFKSSLKTAVKDVEVAVANKDVEAANACLPLAFKKLDKANAKGILHKNNVARHKSRLTLLVNSLQKTE